MKVETIPRLELSGVLTLVHLISELASAWEVDCRDCYLWTDSTIVLGWLNAQAVRLKVYVTNRVAQILELIDPKQWHYVISTEENSANLISRDISERFLSKTLVEWSEVAI